MKKNTAAFVLALFGAIFGLIGGIMMAACADTCADVIVEAGPYVAGFIILGMGGAVVGLIGGIRAFGFKSGAFLLTLFGLLLEIGQLILICVFIGEFVFVLTLWTLLSIIMLFIAVIFAKKKP